MPLLPGKKNIGRNIQIEKAHGKPKKQAIAIALDVARRGGFDLEKKTKKRLRKVFKHGTEKLQSK